MLEPTAEIRNQIAIERVAALRRSAQLPMRRKIVVAAVLAGALSTGAAVVPARAHESHGSCKAFGQTVSENARTTQPWGQIVSNGAQLGLSSALVTEAHTVEGLCEPRS
jgi:hypothetical protein